MAVSPPVAPNPLPDQDQLENINLEGDVPSRRLQSASAAHELFMNAFIADREASRDRANVQDMIDGAPPFDQRELDAMGQGQRANLNFNEGFAECEQALTAYNDLTSSVDHLATFELEYGDNQERHQWESVMAEEFDTTLRAWLRLEFNVQDLSRNFIGHGLGVNYWENEWDWRWMVAGLADFLLPRHTPATTADLDYCFMRRRYTTPQLYDFIKDPKVATKAGWNVETVKEAIANATTSPIVNYSTMDWEKVEAEIKENNILYGRTRTKEVHVLHCYVVEFSGKVSHYITTEDGTSNDFLYKKEDRFESIDQCLQIFTYGIGNGFYHSIRGLGYKIFPQVQVNNQLRCSLIDSGSFHMSQILQVDDAATLDQLAFNYMGPYTIIPSSAKIAEIDRPDLGKLGLPIIEHLTQQLHAQTGTYQPRGGNLDSGSGDRKTKFEVQARLQQGTTLSTSAMNLFYIPWERTLNEAYRRMVQPGLQQNFPGGREAWEFRRRCLQRDVPQDAFHKVKRVHAVRAVGYGSASARMLAQDQIMQLAQQLDEVGRRNAIRDSIAAHVGWAQADRYAPPLAEGIRPLADEKIAEMENSLMLLGANQEIGKIDNHPTHLKVHGKEIGMVIQAIKAGAVSGPQGSGQLHLLLPHSAAHVKEMAMDPTRKFLIKEFNVALNLAEGFVEELDHNIAEQQQAAAKAGEQMSASAQSGAAPVPGAQAPGEGEVALGGQGAQMPPGADPKTAALLRASQVKMDIQQREAALKMQIEAAKGKQKIAIEDARVAHRVAHQAGLASQEDYQNAEKNL